MEQDAENIICLHRFGLREQPKNKVEYAN